MKKIIIIGIAGIVLAAAVTLVIFSLKKLSPKAVTPPTSATTSAPIVTTPSLTPAQFAQAQAATDLKVFVKKFTEIYGSYSTDNHFENLESLKPMMTEAMVAVVNKIIADGVQTKGFYGISTRLVSQTIESQNSTTAVVRAKTQRQETKLDGPAVIRYQDLLLNLVKTNSGWLVDQAQWQ